jgi:NitT/TauT family transport system permease protein
MPVGNLMSALPIIGIAPIMVMWFGFDWQSKAAVVVVMTFFPMLVNTWRALPPGSMERDLMHTYAATTWQTLFKLRLPAAMPFIFNALKINSTLALIGAIVAEFFGTPIVGMGFRISTAVGSLNIDLVWAEIFVAALAGSLTYGADSSGRGPSRSGIRRTGAEPMSITSGMGSKGANQKEFQHEKATIAIAMAAGTLR